MSAPPKNAVQEQIDDHLYQDDDDYDPDEDRQAWLEAECGLMNDGQCLMAGTEHCDFTCPWRDSEDFAGSAAWIKKHEKK